MDLITIHELSGLIILGQCTKNLATVGTTAKGQLILKVKLAVFKPSKNEPIFFDFYPSLLGQKFCVRFLKELKTPLSFFFRFIDL